MVLWMASGYLALAASFYMVLAATATDRAVPALGRRPKWHRTRRVQASVLRRLPGRGR